MSAVTIKDVANRCGVGIGTVSRVLNNSSQISEETRRKVLKAIDELNYVPNTIGKKLSKNRSYVIAVIVPVINHPYFAKLIEAIELEADSKGYSLLVASSQHRIEKEKDILNKIRQNEADGALFVTHYEHKEEEFKNLAIVSIDRHLSDNIPIITTNNYEATEEGVEYLIDKGCKKIAFIGTKPSEASEVILREKAYVDTMNKHHLTPIVINKNVNHGEEEKIVDELLEKHGDVDGVFVSGCILANTLRKKLSLFNKKVPEELQIISYDGDFQTDNPLSITSMTQPLNEMAKRCVELLIKLINKEEINEHINKFNCRFEKGKTTK